MRVRASMELHRALTRTMGLAGMISGTISSSLPMVGKWTTVATIRDSPTTSFIMGQTTAKTVSIPGHFCRAMVLSGRETSALSHVLAMVARSALLAPYLAATAQAKDQQCLGTLLIWTHARPRSAASPSATMSTLHPTVARHSTSVVTLILCGRARTSPTRTSRAFHRTMTCWDGRVKS